MNQEYEGLLIVYKIDQLSVPLLQVYCNRLTSNCKQCKVYSKQGHTI